MSNPAYPLQIFWDEDSAAYVCIAPDLPGCSTVGDSPHEAVIEMEIAQKLWLDACASMGRPLPEPSRRAA